MTSGSTATSTSTTGVATTGAATTGAATTGAATTGATTTAGTTGTVATTGAATTGAGGASSTGSSSATTGSTIPATFETVKLVLSQSSITCIGSDCHGGFENRLDLRDDPSLTPGLYERLTTWTSDVCGKVVVSPSNPDASALLQVLTTGCNFTPGCEIGTACIPRMPYNCTDGFDCTPPEYIEAIRQWIAAGAPPT